MNRRTLSFTLTLLTGCALLAMLVLGVGGPRVALADNAYQTLPFAQDWSNVSQFTANNNWDGVPGIQGYDGADPNNNTAGLDPCTLTNNPFGSLSVSINRQHPDMITDVPIAQFVPSAELTNPVVGIRAQTLYDAPFLLIRLNTTGASAIRVQYDLIDIDQSGSNALSRVALQYRIGETGAFTNVPEGCQTDVTEGPSLMGKVTHVDVTLPAAANNRAQLQLRIMTYNAAGDATHSSADEWIGIDNINITANGAAVPTNTPGPQPTQNPALTHKVYLPFISR